MIDIAHSETNLIFSYYNCYKTQYEKNFVSLIEKVEERKYTNYIRYLLMFELKDAIEKNKYQLIAFKFGILTKQHPLLNYLKQQNQKLKNASKQSVIFMWIQKNMNHIHSLIYERSLYVPSYTNYMSFLTRVFDLDYNYIVSKIENL